MAANLNVNTILGTKANGQGSVIAAWQATTLRAIAINVRGLSLCLGYWLALVFKRMPAGMTPAAATCWKNSNRRHQRHQRWMSGVVVDPGTVGVG
jgi:hypothetical protein